MNRGSIVRECFSHNQRVAGRKPDEIVWVDNGSTDGTADFARENADICVLNRKNLGMAHGFNTAFALATGDLIVMMGAYSKAPDGWLEAMLNVLEASKAEGVCIFHAPVDAEPGRFRGGVEVHAGYVCQKTLFIEAQLFHKSILDKYGYFDESLDPYWPCDVEYAFRTDHHGFYAVAINGMTVEHCGRGQDVEPMMPNPNGDGMLPYWEWKKMVQWSPQVNSHLHALSERGWPRIGLNQKLLP
jgi:GT2 family glycosyltransferase